MVAKKSFIKKNSGLIFTASIVLIILLTGLSIYLYKKSRSSEQKNASEVQSIVNKVGKLMYLPTDEIPTVATVSDPSALKDQAFFVDAKVGDKVLIYTNAKKAILYDPRVNKIVTIAPLNIGDQKPTIQDSATTSINTKPSSTTTDKSGY